MNQKYIRLKEMGINNDVILMFPSLIDHKEFTQQLGYTKDDVVSAGFVCIVDSDMGNPKYKCFGRSVSLNLDSIPDEDDKHLNYQLYGTYDQEDF